MKQTILGLTLVVGLIAGCAGAPILPTSMNATLKASLDADRSKFDATGRGEEYEYAVADAEKVAVAKALQSLVQTDKERQLYSFIEKKLFETHKRFVEGAELRDRRREPDGSLMVKMDIIVNKTTLENELVSKGVIQPKAKLIKNLRNPSVAVLMSPKDASKDWADFAINHSTSYLTGRQFQVLNLKQVAQLEEMKEVVGELDGAAPDSLASVALQIGSDIYLEVEATIDGGAVGSNQTVKASASIKAYETTTARQLGAASGFSNNYAEASGTRNKALAEALSDATDRVMTSIMEYWKGDVNKGNQFLITIRGDFSGAEGQKLRRGVHKVVRTVTDDMKQNIATDKTVNYRVWFTGDAPEMLFGLQEEVEAILPGRLLRSVVENRKLLVLSLE